MSIEKYGIRPSLKLLAVYLILNQKPIGRLIDGLNVPEIIDFQNFIWELSVQFGIKVKGKSFSRREITHSMISSAAYQQRMNCAEDVYFCKGTYCIHAHPECATQKIKEHVETMAEVIRGFIQSIDHDPILV